MKLTTSKSMALTVLVGVVVFSIWFGYRVTQIPKDAYAVWWTADLVIEHMEKNDGRWPHNWDELRKTSDHANQGAVSTNRDGTWVAEFRPRENIEALRRRVEIDWNADPRELAKAEFREGSVPFRVIRLRNGRSTSYSGKEPNNMILEYLKSKETNK